MQRKDDFITMEIVQLTDTQEEQVSNSLRALSTQLLRYIRGAGDIHQLRLALHDATETVKITEDIPAYALQSSFGSLQEWGRDRPGIKETWERMEDDAIDQIALGALQLVATRLSGSSQGGMHDRAVSQILKGINIYEEARDERRSHFGAV